MTRRAPSGIRIHANLCVVLRSRVRVAASSPPAGEWSTMPTHPAGVHPGPPQGTRSTRPVGRTASHPERSSGRPYAAHVATGLAKCPSSLRSTTSIARGRLRKLPDDLRDHRVVRMVGLPCWRAARGPGDRTRPGCLGCHDQDVGALEGGGADRGRRDHGLRSGRARSRIEAADPAAQEISLPRPHSTSPRMRSWSAVSMPSARSVAPTLGANRASASTRDRLASSVSISRMSVTSSLITSGRRFST